MQIWIILVIVIVIIVLIGVLLLLSWKNTINTPIIELNKSTTNNLDYFSTNNILVSSTKLNQDNFFVYNPSIQWNNNEKTEIMTIARVSGHTMIPRLKNCIQSHSRSNRIDLTDIEGLQDYLDIFGEQKGGASGVVKYMIHTQKYSTVTATLLNPFYSKENLCKKNYQGFEDPRVFRFNQKLWIICYFRGKNFPYPSLVDTSKFGHYIIIFPLDMSVNPVLLHYADRQKLEKNWMPFEYNNKLYVVYSISPHKILHVDIHTGNCTKIFETKNPNSPKEDIGNGSPPQLITINGNRYYLGMGHIRGRINGDMIRKNFLYLFESTPPFSVVSVSKVFNILSSFIPIEFGSGLLVDEENQYVYVSFGIDDCSGSIIKIPIPEVIALLPIKSL